MKWRRLCEWERIRKEYLIREKQVHEKKDRKSEKKSLAGLPWKYSHIVVVFKYFQLSIVDFESGVFWKIWLIINDSNFNSK